MRKLVEPVVGVLQHVARVVAELGANRDEVHRDQQGGEGQEAERAFPADGLVIKIFVYYMLNFR